MKHSYKTFDLIDEESDKRERREMRKRRVQKNWTRFYQDHVNEYEDLEEFHLT